MQIFKDYDTIFPDKLQLKTPKAFSGGYFIEIKIKKKPIYILTPKLKTPFGLNPYGNGISVTFTDSDLDPKIAEFQHLIEKLDTFFHNNCHLISDKLASYCTPDTFIYTTSLKRDEQGFPPLMVLKTQKNNFHETSAYDQYKQKIPLENIKENSFLTSIIELSGIWIRNNGNIWNYGLQWNLIQLRIDPPMILEPFAILDDPPPPPPPPPPPLPTMTPRKSIASIINENRKVLGKKPLQIPPTAAPTLNDIKAGLGSLKKPEPKSCQKAPQDTTTPMEKIFDELKTKLERNRQFLRLT